MIHELFIIPHFQTKVNKKMTKKLLFLFILLALRSLIVSGEAGSMAEWVELSKIK